MIFGIRHGERADFDYSNNVESGNEKNLIEITFDPHLTPTGVKQAIHTGKFIQEKIDEYESHLKETNSNSGQPLKVIIVTSPFLRTLQTAFHISQNIKNLHQNTIFVQDHFCEYLQEGDFQSHPLADLFYRTRKIDELQNYLDLQGSGITLKDNLFEDGNLEIPQYVEKNVDERVEKTLKSLFNHYINSYNHNEYVLIYVTHAQIIRSSLDYLGVFYDFVNYCGVVQIQFPEAQKKNAEKYKVLIRGDSSHLKWEGLI